MALDYLVALPGRCCSWGRLDLLLHHHHLPPPRCLHGTRLVLSPGEGSAELAALRAKEGGRDGGTKGGTAGTQNGNQNVTPRHEEKQNKETATARGEGGLGLAPALEFPPGFGC